MTSKENRWGKLLGVSCIHCRQPLTKDEIEIAIEIEEDWICFDCHDEMIRQEYTTYILRGYPYE